jgi:hypothetical protein
MVSPLAGVSFDLGVLSSVMSQEDGDASKDEFATVSDVSPHSFEAVFQDVNNGCLFCHGISAGDVKP